MGRRTDLPLQILIWQSLAGRHMGTACSTDTMIRAGASRPLLVEVQASERAGERHLLCLAQGCDLADRYVIKKPSFALRLNQQYSSAFYGAGPDRIRQGQIVKWRPHTFSALPPLHAGADGESLDLDASDAKTGVFLQSQLNELSLVELQCVALGNRRTGG